MEQVICDPTLANAVSAKLSGGTFCVSAWAQASQGLLKRLRILQLNQQGKVLHTADINALRGQVAGGPDGSCAVLYDRAPSAYKGEYYLTVFDRSFARRWTVPVNRTSLPGAEFRLASLSEGYLAQIHNALVEYSWSGKEMWAEVETRGSVRTLVTPTRDGFFIVTKDLDMKNGFHVKRAITSHE